MTETEAVERSNSTSSLQQALDRRFVCAVRQRMPPSSEEVKGGGESVQVSGDTSVPWQHNAAPLGVAL